VASDARGYIRGCQGLTFSRLERNQSNYILLSFVQGRRSLGVASTLTLRFRDTSTLVPLYLNGKQSILPMHAKEIKTGTIEAIKKQLGVK